MDKLNLYIADISSKDDRLVSISFVNTPAIGLKLTILSQDDDSMTIAAPIIIANKPIFRNDKYLGSRNVFFLPETISDIIKKGTYERSIYVYDIEHDGNQIDDVLLIESFTIDYQRGITGYKGLYGLTDGSWVGKFFIKNKKLIDYIKSNKVNGLSISAYLTEEKVQLNDAIEIYNKIQ